MEDRLKLWLYKNDYATTDKHPVRTGTGEVSKDVIREMVEKIKAGKEDTIKLQCAAWENTSKSGTPYLFVTVEVGERKKKEDGDSIPF
jgi:hypothetical protein